MISMQPVHTVFIMEQRGIAVLESVQFADFRLQLAQDLATLRILEQE